MVRGGLADRQREGQAIPRERAVTRPNGRSGVDRRKKDGLGILPRATTPEERDRRGLYNQAVIILLVFFGGITGLATLDMALTRPALWPTVWPGPVLGLILVARGVYLTRRPDRRQDDRRRQ